MKLYQFEHLSAYALRLLILTATRTKEVIEAKFDEFDLQRRIWTIPAEKMKVEKSIKYLYLMKQLRLLNL